MHALLAWWTLVTAKLGVPATLLLLLYLAALVWLLVDVTRGLGQQLRYQMLIKRRLRALHHGRGWPPLPSALPPPPLPPSPAVSARRRAELGAHDAS